MRQLKSLMCVFLAGVQACLHGCTVPVKSHFGLRHERLIVASRELGEGMIFTPCCRLPELHLPPGIAVQVFAVPAEQCSNHLHAVAKQVGVITSIPMPKFLQLRQTSVHSVETFPYLLSRSRGPRLALAHEEVHAEINRAARRTPS